MKCLCHVVPYVKNDNLFIVFLVLFVSNCIYIAAWYLSMRIFMGALFMGDNSLGIFMDETQSI